LSNDIYIYDFDLTLDYVASSPLTSHLLSLPSQSLKLSDRTSLHYRRLNQLFFQEDTALPDTADSNIQIGHFVLQRIHASPNIYVIDNFLNASELQYLQHKIASSRFQRSYVDHVATIADDTTAAAVENAGSHYDTSHRTSTFLSFQKQQDAKVAGLEQKAAALLGCWSSSSAIEPLQLVRYLPGQFFGVHHDMGDYDEETGAVHLPPKSLYCKRRVVTLFCYLNAVEAGGATYFPSATTGKNDSNGGLRVEPVPGRAVLFSNILATGQPDPRTIHAGEPVTAGTKYGLNVWICED
jgi:2OG-Fe(II) oxygenase superfamily